MTRRGLFELLFQGGLGVTGVASIPQKFYVTGGHTEDERGYRDDCKVPPLVCFGKDRIDALSRSGITVWTEAEYLRSHSAFVKTC